MPTPVPSARFLDPADPQVQRWWAALLARSAQASIFSRLAYAEAVATAFGLTYRLAGVLKGERLAAGVLLFEQPLGPYRRVVVPPLTPYTSFLLADPLRETDVHQRASAVDALLALLHGRYHALCFHLHPTLTDVRAFQWAGYQVQPLYTYRRPLVDEATLLGEVSKGVRRRYERLRASYQLDETPAAVEAVTSLVEASYRRSGRPAPVAMTQRRAFIAQLQAAGLARVFTATPAEGTEPEGGQVMLVDASTAYALMGGSTPGPAMTVLLVHVLLQVHREGVAWVDFVGANTPSIAEFKRSFGTHLTPYYRAVRLARPALRLLHALRPVL